MSAPLTISAAYQAYPAGVAAGLGFQEYYWHSPEEDDEEPEAGRYSQEESGTLQDPDVSPVTSTSGLLTHYAPDSASSPNRHPSSPHPASVSQRSKADSERAAKKSKSRTTFSQEQLQVLHLRFQSQKYLSPQQIRELGSALGLTYKQVKTWFQNQRMKFKRTQKETLWMKKGMCPPQNGFQQAGCLDLLPPPPQDYSMNPARSIHSLSNVHEGSVSNQSYGSSQNYPNDYSSLYGSPQSFYPVVAGENGGFYGKAAGTCYGQQAISYVSQQKMNFYHGFSASVEYAAVKMEDGYPFSNGSASTAAFPSSSVVQHYQTPLQTQGTQGSCNP
ncbi:homeobox protein NANOG-like [Eublepharis macularius]|uniref:Homeobox protein NANOG-like n=1 Tax=Eublepharis macularius TaxID=481883 RepID=A0AA97KLR3_EUBMA|nr:homeobox protein NANOG-like [Eublepharis macularius]